MTRKQKNGLCAVKRKNYSPLNINLKKGVKEKYKAFAASRGMSVTEMITRYLDSEIEKAGFEYKESADE